MSTQGWPGVPLPPLIFGVSVNPITTHRITTSTLNLFDLQPSLQPILTTSKHPLNSCLQLFAEYDPHQEGGTCFDTSSYTNPEWLPQNKTCCKTDHSKLTVSKQRQKVGTYY